jgi:hypothetical protein
MLITVLLLAGSAGLLAYAALQLAPESKQLAPAVRVTVASFGAALIDWAAPRAKPTPLDVPSSMLSPVGSPSWLRGKPWSLSIPGAGKRAIPVPRSLVTMIALPGAFYLFVFVLLMYPIFAVFSTDFWADQGDGMQNVWNIWWINKAVTDLHQSPWRTGYLHYPYGISLIGHTMNPFNGFVGILLLRAFSLIQTYNLLILFTFVAGGVTSFLLAHHLTQSYIASLVGGFVFAFSSFHVAHAQLHMQIASLEWIPLFVLCWYRLVTDWQRLWAVLSAVVLLLVLLCDYYYFFYCVVVATLLLIWSLVRSRIDRSLLVRQGKALIVFGVCAGLLAGPLVLALLMLNHNDPLLGAHSASDFALDLPAPFIPGTTWRFSDLTQGYWSHIFDPVEGSGYLGIVVVVLAVYVWFKRRRVQSPGLAIWYVIGLLFLVLAVGPVAHLRGTRLASPFPLPYSVAESVFPILQVSGVPVRMIVITTLCASVIVAFGFRLLLSGSVKTKLVAVLMGCVLFVEYLPHPLFASHMVPPPWIAALQRQPVHGPIVDTFDMPSLQLYYQTLLNVPIAFGYVARTPTSVWEADQKLATASSETRGDVLHRHYGFRYFIARAASGYDLNPTLYRDSQVAVYELWRQSSGSRAQYTPTQPDARAGELLAGDSLGQTFTAGFAGLDEVGFYLTNYGHLLTGRLVFHLRYASRAGSGPDLARVVMDLSTLSDNSVQIFHFRPIQGSSGRRFYAFLEAPQSGPGNAPSAAGSVHDTYSGGNVMINNVPGQGDLVLQLYYKSRR